MAGERDEAAVRRRLLVAQQNEITEHHIYRSLAARTADPHNREVLDRIAREEREHYGVWKEYTGEDVPPDHLKIRFFSVICRVFGLTFGIKLMEKGEDRAQLSYAELADLVPDARRILEDEERHERELIDHLDEERLRYVGSVVLGLNDALVELTGTLAGLSFALQNTRLIAVAGLITGSAASLSMAASEYLSEKTAGDGRDPVRAALYTGSAYVITVIYLILPFLLLADYRAALALTLGNALVVILLFTLYVAVARDLDFKRRFLEMAAISLGVAAISFGIGMVIRLFLGVEV